MAKDDRDVLMRLEYTRDWMHNVNGWGDFTNSDFINIMDVIAGAITEISLLRDDVLRLNEEVESLQEEIAGEDW